MTALPEVAMYAGPHKGIKHLVSSECHLSEKDISVAQVIASFQHIPMGN
jgi:hypothetical protein